MGIERSVVCKADARKDSRRYASAAQHDVLSNRLAEAQSTPRQGFRRLLNGSLHKFDFLLERWAVRWLPESRPQEIIDVPERDEVYTHRCRRQEKQRFYETLLFTGVHGPEFTESVHLSPAPNLR